MEALSLISCFFVKKEKPRCTQVGEGEREKKRERPYDAEEEEKC